MLDRGVDTRVGGVTWANSSRAAAEIIVEKKLRQKSFSKPVGMQFSQERTNNFLRLPLPRGKQTVLRLDLVVGITIGEPWEADVE